MTVQHRFTPFCIIMIVFSPGPSAAVRGPAGPGGHGILESLSPSHTAPGPTAGRGGRPGLQPPDLEPPAGRCLVPRPGACCIARAGPAELDVKHKSTYYYVQPSFNFQLCVLVLQSSDQEQEQAI